MKRQNEFQEYWRKVKLPPQLTSANFFVTEPFYSSFKKAMRNAFRAGQRKPKVKP